MASAEFESAVESVKGLTRDPGNDVKLRLYALYKQVTEGDAFRLAAGDDEPRRAGRSTTPGPRSRAPPPRRPRSSTSRSSATSRLPDPRPTRPRPSSHSWIGVRKPAIGALIQRLRRAVEPHRGAVTRHRGMPPPAPSPSGGPPPGTTPHICATAPPARLPRRPIDRACVTIHRSRPSSTHRAVARRLVVLGDSSPTRPVTPEMLVEAPPADACRLARRAAALVRPEVDRRRDTTMAAHGARRTARAGRHHKIRWPDGRVRSASTSPIPTPRSRRVRRVAAFPRICWPR